MDKIYLSIETSLLITTIIGIFFVSLGYINTKKISNKRNYIVGDRNEGVFSLTTSLTASALGAWILFGPASAATWGGIGAVIGYAAGTAAPMLFLYNFGPKIRKEFPNGLSLTDYIDKRFGRDILKICLFLILFYLIIFLVAEVTAIAFLLKFTSNMPLWATSAITLMICLLYVLRGGFKLSIITDKYQFSFILIIILIAIYFILKNTSFSSFDIIKINSPNLINKNYLPNYTSGLTFFIAVAATNLFHQGNWQRVFSAHNDKKLKSSLIISSVIIFIIVFWMGYSGLISVSLDPKTIPDLAFFNLVFKSENKFLIAAILILALSLTLSTIDTLINSISSLIIINGKEINKSLKGKDIKIKSNITIILLSLFVFLFASKGYSILYLFLLADLLCCSAVIIIFYGFFTKKLNSNIASKSIFLALLSGILFFPNQSFNSSILVGYLLPIDAFNTFITTNLLFISFVVPVIIQFLSISFYSLRSSFR